MTTDKFRAPRTSYQVLLCCNDERGNFTGFVTELDIADEIRIVCTKERGTAIRFDAGAVKIGRHKFSCGNGRSSWVGNVFWDSITMTTEQARSVLSYLLANGWAVEEWAEEGPFADFARKSA
jgi:hypothetical protein